MTQVPELFAAAIVLVLLLAPGLAALALARLDDLGPVEAAGLGLAIQSLAAYLLGLAGANFAIARLVMVVLAVISLVACLRWRTALLPPRPSTAVLLLTASTAALA